MSRRIGEALIEKELITRVQLQDALKSQLFFGGQVGTSLIELGYVSEDDLGQTLAECMRVRYAPYEMLADIHDRIIAKIPPELAEKQKVIPLKLERKTLHVAAIDPKRLTALSSTTGHKIVVYVSPETRILQALERYYRIPQRPRHIKILSDLEKSASGNRPLKMDPMVAGPPPPGLPTATAQAVATESTEPDPGETLAAMSADAEYGYGRSWRDVLDEVVEDEGGEGGSWEGDERRAHRLNLDPSATLEDAAKLLSRVETKDRLADVALAFAGARLKRAMLFRVKGEQTFLWDSVGLDRRVQKLKKVGFPLTAGSVFTLLLGEEYFCGQLKNPEQFQWFYKSLGFDPPKELLLVPIYLNDRLLAILYGDGGRRGRIKGSIEEFRQLGQKIGLALNMLVLKMRILSE